MTENQGLSANEFITKYKTIIHRKSQKVIKTSKMLLNFKEVQSRLAEDLANNPSFFKDILIFQQTCLRINVNSFHSYFILKAFAISKKENKLLLLQTFSQDLVQGVSQYNKIKNIIKMREMLLAKINQNGPQYTKDIFENIDDIRFMNFEIINMVNTWKLKIKELDDKIEPVFYDFEMNYLIKIMNDNAQIINIANFKKTKFISPPNPFFLSEDGNIHGMSSKQQANINQCMQILAQEKSKELRMLISPPQYFVNGAIIKNQEKDRKKRSNYSLEIHDLKKQIESDKNQEIKKIYKINKSISSQRLKTRQIKEEIQYKNSQYSAKKKYEQKLIKQKASESLKNQYQSEKSSKVKDNFKNKIEKNIYKELKKKTDKNEKQFSKVGDMSKISFQINKLQKQKNNITEVREIKPKMRIIDQRQTAVEQNVKNIFNMIINDDKSMVQSRTLRKTNTFYKKIEPIAQIDQQSFQIKPITQISQKNLVRSSTAINFKPNKNKSIELNKRNTQNGITANSLKNLTIINIYKTQKTKKMLRQRKNSASASKDIIKQQQDNINTSFLTQVPKQMDLSISRYSDKLNNLKKQKRMKQLEYSQIIQKKNTKQQQKRQKIKQKQFKQKQNSLMRKFKQQVKEIEKKNLQKQKMYQQILLKEKKSLKQTQLKLAKAKHIELQVQKQLQNKRLKQKLVRQILNEKQNKDKLEEQKQLQQPLNLQLEEIRRIQQQTLMIYELQKQKIQLLYEEAKIKNIQIEELNRKKQQQLMNMEQQYQKLAVQLNRSIAQSNILLQNKFTQEAQGRREAEIAEKIQTQDQNSLKQKIKLEIMNQIKKRKQLQEEQQKNQQNLRQERIRRIQKEIQQTLHEEEERIEIEHQKFLESIDKVKGSYKIQNLEEKGELITNNEQGQKKDKQQIQMNQVKGDQNQNKTDNKVDASYQTDKIFNKQPNNITFNLQQHKQIKQNSSVNEQKQIQAQKIPAKTKDNNILQKSKLESSSDLLQKYKKLSKLFKKCNLLTVEDTNLMQFLNNFYNQMDVHLRQMLPLSKQQLHKQIINRKVDIFDCQSIGWREADNEKYNLIGNIDCVDAIIKRHGTMQIEQKYIFDKNNPYQKQILAKKIKIYEDIGFVFQKRIGQTSSFSIKLILKIPKQAINSTKFQQKENHLVIKSLVYHSNHKSESNNNQFKANCSFGYLLSKYLKNILKRQQIQSTEHIKSSFESSVINHLKTDEIKSDYFFKLNQTSDGLIQCEINLPLKFYRYYDFGFYLLKAQKHLIGKDDCVFVSHLSQTLSVVIFKYKQSQAPLDFITDEVISFIKPETISQKEVNITVPIWQFKNTAQLQDFNVNYGIKTICEPNLNFGSIINTSLKRYNFERICEPFVFAFCERDNNQYSRSLYGHLIKKEKIKNIS